MSLKKPSIHGFTPGLPEGPPYRCRDRRLAGHMLWMNQQMMTSSHQGENLVRYDLALDNLEGMRHYWNESEWMEMLINSQCMMHKILERQLYMHFWGSYIGPQSRILDLGCGVGRMS